MPTVVPSAYTEEELGAYMRAQLESVAAFQGWAEDADFDEAVADALLAYGQTTIALITGATAIRKLRAHALVAAWALVLDAIIGKTFHLRSGDDDLSLEQVHDQAEKALARARGRLSALTPRPGFALIRGRRGQ